MQRAGGLGRWTGDAWHMRQARVRVRVGVRVRIVRQHLRCAIPVDVVERLGVLADPGQVRRRGRWASRRRLPRLAKGLRGHHTLQIANWFLYLRADVTLEKLNDANFLANAVTSAGGL